MSDRQAAFRSAAHGAPGVVDEQVWLGPDPELALAEADMDVWLAAHPCTCEALCECEEQA